MYNITVDKLIEWLQTIPNPKETEVSGIYVGNWICSPKRFIYGKYNNYGKNENKFFVLQVPMGTHFPSTHDERANKDWEERGQIKPSDSGGENINSHYDGA